MTSGTDSKSNEVWTEAAVILADQFKNNRDGEELAQEALCQAWALARSAEQRDKAVELNSFTYYGAKAARSGRKFAGSTRRDISRSTRPEGAVAGVRFLGLSQWARAASHRNPLDAAILADGIAGLTSRQRTIVRLLGEGYLRIEIARMIGVSPATITVEAATITAILAG